MHTAHNLTRAPSSINGSTRLKNFFTRLRAPNKTRTEPYAAPRPTGEKRGGRIVKLYNRRVTNPVEMHRKYSDERVLLGALSWVRTICVSSSTQAIPHCYRYALGRCSPGIYLIGIILLVSLSGGTCLRVERNYPTPLPEQILYALHQRGTRIKTFRGEARMNQKTEQGKIKATVRFMAERKGKLRYDLVSPFDTPLFTLVADGRNFVLVDARKNKYYYGPASPCNIARLTQVMLQPDDLLVILSGSTPIISYQQVSLSWDDKLGAEVLTLRGKDTVQTIRLDGRNRSWDLLQSEIANLNGEVRLRIEASDYHLINGLSIPQIIKVSQPKIKAEFAIVLKKEEINLGLPEAAFELPKSNGLPSQYVDCTTDLAL